MYGTKTSNIACDIDVFSGGIRAVLMKSTRVGCTILISHRHMREPFFTRSIVRLRLTLHSNFVSFSGVCISLSDDKIFCYTYARMEEKFAAFVMHYLHVVSLSCTYHMHSVTSMNDRRHTHTHTRQSHTWVISYSSNFFFNSSRCCRCTLFAMSAYPS